MFKELKAFLFKANVLDFAVAVVIGGAFNAIVTSLVKDVITPLFLTPILKATGVEKIAELSWNGVSYGNFLSAIINFIIVGVTLFFIIKIANATTTLTKKQDNSKISAPTQEELLTEIRDLLKDK